MTPTPPTDMPPDKQTESLALEFNLAHSPAKVWRALTDPVLLAQWLLPTIGFKLEPGAAFTFKAPPPPGSNWDGTVNCRFREIEPQRKLSWSWVVGDIDTVVTFTLTPIDSSGGAAGGGGTLLSIVQSGFKPNQKQAFGGARYGWKMMSTKLTDLLASIS